MSPWVPPTVESARVSGEIVEQGRGRKVTVFKYKNKTRYRRLRGHRQLQTSVLVNEVSLGDQLWAYEPKARPAETVSEADDESAGDAASDTDTAASEDSQE